MSTADKVRRLFVVFLLSAVAIALILATRARSTVTLFILGGASITAYYWFAAPRLVGAYGGGPALGEAVRLLVLLGIAVWAVRGWRKVGGSVAAGSRPAGGAVMRSGAHARRARSPPPASAR